MKNTYSNNYIDLLDRNSKKYPNAVKIWKKVSLEHMRVMCDIVWKLVNDYNMTCYTEAVFTNGQRSDIFCFNKQMAVAIEILHSETDKKFEHKLSKYPVPIIKINTKDFKIEEFKI